MSSCNRNMFGSNQFSQSPKSPQFSQSPQSSQSPQPRNYPSNPRTPSVKIESEDVKKTKEWNEKMGSVLYSHEWDAEEAAEALSIQILATQSQMYAGRKLTKDGMSMVAAACELLWHEFLKKIPGILVRATVTSGDYGYNACNYVNWFKTVGSFARSPKDAAETIKCLYRAGLCNLFQTNQQRIPENILESMFKNKSLSDEFKVVMYGAYTHPEEDADLTRPMIDIMNKVALCTPSFDNADAAICFSWLCMVRPKLFVEKVFTTCCGFLNGAMGRDGFSLIHNVCMSLKKIVSLVHTCPSKKGFDVIFSEMKLAEKFCPTFMDAFRKLTKDDLVKLFMGSQGAMAETAEENALKVRSVLVAELGSSSDHMAYIEDAENMHMLQYFVTHAPDKFMSSKAVWNKILAHEAEFSNCELARLRNRHDEVFGKRC